MTFHFTSPIPLAQDHDGARNELSPSAFTNFLNRPSAIGRCCHRGPRCKPLLQRPATYLSPGRSFLVEKRYSRKAQALAFHLDPLHSSSRHRRSTPLVSLLDHDCGMQLPAVSRLSDKPPLFLPSPNLSRESYNHDQKLLRTQSLERNRHRVSQAGGSRVGAQA